MEPILLVRCDAFETYGVAPSALAAAGATTRIWDAVDPAAERPDLADASGVVLFGSTSNVEHADERPFIKEVADLTHEAVERGVPFLGLCFGAQILAWALGADVMKARVRELGFEPIRALPAAADDPVLSSTRRSTPPKPRCGSRKRAPNRTWNKRGASLRRGCVRRSGSTWPGTSAAVARRSAGSSRSRGNGHELPPARRGRRLPPGGR
ncbi:MAG: hypothetical protein E6G54_07965 [Actinobacteria bacterium]|nr:MAG: hypothetical protein E6G54_07965 [Actinomycetota bacterium]